MIRRCALVVFLAGSIGFAAPLNAEDQPPGTGDPRFVFYRSDAAYMRLDLQSGDLVACTQRDGEWVCTAVPDERAVLGAEIARLRRENALLKSKLIARGVPLPIGSDAQEAVPPIPLPAPPAVAPSIPPATSQVPDSHAPAPTAASGPPDVALSAPPVGSAPQSPQPSAEAERAAREEAEIDRVMNAMEKVWRRLVDMMITIQREMQKKS
jgi:hypothetical protein